MKYLQFSVILVQSCPNRRHELGVQFDTAKFKQLNQKIQCKKYCGF